MDEAQTIPGWFLWFISGVGGLLSLITTGAIPWAFKVSRDVAVIKAVTTAENKARDDRIERIEVRVERIEGRLASAPA